MEFLLGFIAGCFVGWAVTWAYVCYKIMMG